MQKVSEKGRGKAKRKADTPTFKLLEAGEFAVVFPSPLMLPPYYKTLTLLNPF